MEITINHVITLSAETEYFLKKMLGEKPNPAEVDQPKKAANKPPKQEKAPEPTPVTQEQIKEQVAAAPVVDMTATPPVEVKPAILKMEDVRKRAQDIAMMGKRDEVKKAISDMGAENVPKMDPAKYPEFMAALDKIAG